MNSGHGTPPTSTLFRHAEQSSELMKPGHFIPHPQRAYLCPYCNEPARLRDEGVVIDGFKNPCHEECLDRLRVPVGAPSLIGWLKAEMSGE